MDHESLWDAFRALPPHARQEVADFIVFLRARYNPQSPNIPKDGKLNEEPFIGMWADRSDMTESTAWVRSLRTNEWQRHNE